MLVRRHTLSKWLLVTGISISTLSLAEPIYKATLPDGRVIYTDNVNNAYKQVTDNSQITVIDNLDGKASPTTTSTPSNATSSTRMPESLAVLASMNISSTEASKQGDYQLIIQSPQHETAYHRPAQQVEIRLSITPSLKQGDSIVYSMDDKEIGQSSNTTFSLPSTDLNPGKHTLAVSIVNAMNNPIATAHADFYVILTNPLIKKQKEIIAKRAEYDALPLHTKVGKHLKGEKPPIDPKTVNMRHLDLD